MIPTMLFKKIALFPRILGFQTHQRFLGQWKIQNALIQKVQNLVVNKKRKWFARNQVSFLTLFPME